MGSPNFGCILYAFVGLFRFWKQFSKNGQPGGPSEIIQGDRKFKHNISFPFLVGFKARRLFAVELKINRCFNLPFMWQLRLLMEGKNGSGKDGPHRKEVPRANQKKAQTENFGCRPLGAPVFNFGCILAVTAAISRDGCDY